MLNQDCSIQVNPASERIWMLKFLACFRTLAFAGLLIFLAGCGNSPSQPQPTGRRGGSGGQQAVPVAVAKAEARDVPVFLTGLGSVEAFNTVTLRTRIDGQIMEIDFKEGQNVHKGDLLAVIDPRPYEVQLSQTEANLFKDQAALKDAKVNLERFTDLYNNGGVIAKQQLDTQASMVGQLEGSVLADQAQIDNAKLQLSYTRITAPVNGRVGLRLVDIGNIVHAADANGLLVLTQLQPIAAVFNLPEDNLPAVAQRMNRGSLIAEAYSRDDQTKLATGVLQTIDNQIDLTTGTGKLKAVFQNNENALWPNQFVNIHLLLEVRKNNTVVPSAAIQRGPQGSYVFAVNPDKTVALRPVTVSYSANNFSSIAKGVAPGDMVVTDGQDKLQDKSRVEVRPGGPTMAQKSTESAL